MRFWVVSFEERIAWREVLKASGSWRFVGFLDNLVRLGLEVESGSERSSESSSEAEESELEAEDALSAEFGSRGCVDIVDGGERSSGSSSESARLTGVNPTSASSECEEELS